MGKEALKAKSQTYKECRLAFKAGWAKSKAMSHSTPFQSDRKRNRPVGGAVLQPMNRRKFIHAGALATLGLSALHGYSAEFAEQKKRAGLIGCGWYGKCDLFRLIQ